jgi:diaminopimelate epimerase
MEINFVKMSGSGNDFVILDNRDEGYFRENEKPGFVRKVCSKRTGIGADGVLLVEKSERFDFKMRYFNADGGEVAFCGNGARCIAHYAHNELGFKPKLNFDSLAGGIIAEVFDRRAKILMPTASTPIGPKVLFMGNEKLEYYFVNTGVPHVVVFVDDLKNYPVSDIGKKIRLAREFAPSGTNANFAERVSGDADIAVRTYERGVEDETLACGTGATAVAIVAQHLGFAKYPIEIKVALPDILTIGLGEKGRPTLEGSVTRVFSGVYLYEKAI